MLNSRPKRDTLFSDYGKRLAASNQKMNSYVKILCETCGFQDKFRYRNVFLWDVISGQLAARDCFCSAPETGRTGSVTRIFLLIKKIANKLIHVSFLNLSLKHFESNKTDALFFAFERRQANCFSGLFDLVDELRFNFAVISTAVPSHPFQFEIELQKAFSIERFLIGADFLRLYKKYKELQKFLILADCQVRKLPAAEARDFSQFLRFLKKNLLRSLIYLESSYLMLEKASPKVLVSADTADLRCRAVFLMGKTLGIKSIHMLYGHTTPECFEEMYPVADLTVVASENQKELLVKYFGVSGSTIKVVGYPRFDHLFAMRPKEFSKDSFELKQSRVFLASQSSACNTFFSFREFKLQRIESLLSSIHNLGANPQVLIKFHPDESTDDRSEIIRIAKASGVNFQIVETIDYSTLNPNSDLLICFGSMVSFEFTILGIPVFHLVSVQNIPILNKACDFGLAAEALSDSPFEDIVKFFSLMDVRDYAKYEEYLFSEFTVVDGSASKSLLEVITQSVKKPHVT